MDVFGHDISLSIRLTHIHGGHWLVERPGCVADVVATREQVGRQHYNNL